MEADSETKGKQLRIDGGAVSNNLLMQFQSDLFGFKVIRPKTLETTALGAAYLAGLAVGYWKDVEDLHEQWTIDREFTPEMPQKDVDKLIKNWKKAVVCSSNWIED
jgi:glycerol kinase